MKEAFKTGKKYMLALDVSGSMTYSGCQGCSNITPAEASAALAMMTWHLEGDCEVFAFGGHFTDIKNQQLRKEMTIMEAVKSVGDVSEYSFLFYLEPPA